VARQCDDVWRAPEEDAMNRRFHFLLVTTLACAMAGAQADGSRAVLIEARNLAYDANYRNDQAGLRSAIEVLEPLTKVPAEAAYANYYLSWTYAALWAAQFQARDAAGALSAAKRAVEYARQALVSRPNDADFHAQLASALTAAMFSDTPQFKTLYEELKAVRHRAVELGPKNPRAVMFEAGMIFNDPAEGPGAQQRGLARWHEALRLFEAEANEPSINPIAPRWGYAAAYGMLAAMYARTQPPQLDDARRAAETALRMRPDFWYVREVVVPQLRK
jgi:tetratricopeptide (TPR) repeat protein